MRVMGKDSVLFAKTKRRGVKNVFVSGVLFRIATLRRRSEAESPFRTHWANFKPKVIAKKSTSNFGDSERFAYLCVRKITTNEITHKYSLT